MELDLLTMDLGVVTDMGDLISICNIAGKGIIHCDGEQFLH